MAMSMTGYGRSFLTSNDTEITVEIRTVNHRFIDISTKIPRSFMFLEDKIKKVIQSFFERGRIEVFINLNGNELTKQNLIVNWDLMDQYLNQFKEIKDYYQLSGDVSIEMVSQLEGLYSIQEEEQFDDTLVETILTGITNACHQAVEMRQIEGQQLIKDLNDRNKFIKKLVKQLGERRDTVIIEYRERIKQRIEEYTNTVDLNDDKSKIYQDIAILAEKGDITEEVTRLNSHVNQFLTAVKQEGSIGRKLDFIVQEMHREANTIGSKSNDIHLSEIVVTLKSEIEKIKEQIQNLE